MKLTAGELRFKIFILQQDGLMIPDFDNVVKKLCDLEKETGGDQKSIDEWCGMLSELEVCRNALGMDE